MAQRVSTNTSTLPELILAGRAGNQDAFTALFERYQVYAWSVAIRTTSNRTVAEEAVIDGFATALGSLDRLRDELKFPGYLASCVRNEVLMSVRRAKPLVQVDSLEEHASQDLSPEGAFEASEESQRAFAAFQRLDDRQQQVIMLVDVEGVPASEAAAALDMKPNALYQLLFRARRMLRLRYIAPALGDESPQECRDCNERLGEYVNATASARAVGLVDRHLATCEDCQTRLAEVREVSELLTTARGIIPVGIFASLANRYESMGAKALHGRGLLHHAHTARNAALAAGVVLALSGSVASAVLLTSDVHHGTKPIPRAEAPRPSAGAAKDPATTPASTPPSAPATTTTTTTTNPHPSAASVLPILPPSLLFLKPLVLSSTMTSNGSGYSVTLLEGVSLSSTITASNPNPGAPVPSLTSVGSLPAGISFTANGGDGLFSGIARSPGVYVTTITASEASGANVMAQVTITVDEVPVFTSAPTLNGTVGSPISFPVTAAGFPLPAFTAFGALPPGLQLVDHGSSVSIQGTPLSATSSPADITVTASNSFGSTQQVIEISISA
jgi:RNA polymerase sigma factor (sigma-70 family)